MLYGDQPCLLISAILEAPPAENFMATMLINYINSFFTWSNDGPSELRDSITCSIYSCRPRPSQLIPKHRLRIIACNLAHAIATGFKMRPMADKSIDSPVDPPGKNEIKYHNRATN